MRIFTKDIPVVETDIDQQHHVNNVRYIEWMQDIAIGHSAALGWDINRYDEVGQGWVVHQHKITYRRPAVLGDIIEGYTWVSTLGSRASIRCYLFVRKSDKAIIAEAETEWVFIDAKTGRPLRIPEELRKDFPLVEKDEVLALIKKV